MTRMTTPPCQVFLTLIYANCIAFLCRPTALDSSATETEDETVRLGITPASARKNKTRKKKKERDKTLKSNRKIKNKLKKEKGEKKKEKQNNIQQSKKKLDNVNKRPVLKLKRVRAFSFIIIPIRILAAPEKTGRVREFFLHFFLPWKV